MNNKGFSMVEILAVVVILGVISTIGIVTITRLVDNSRIHYYETQEKQLVLAAQSYANDNKNILPKTVGEMRIITLKELRENNYIKEEIVDQNKNKCYEEKHKEKDKNGNEVELEGSRVEVYKSTKTDYIYTGYLECDACVKFQENDDGNIAPTSCYTSETKKEPSIKINFPNVTNETPLTENDVVQIEIKGTEGNENIKVASYSYKIYVNNIIKKNSGLKINNKQHLVTINNNKLFNLVPGKIKVVVTATNSDGISKTIAASKDLSNLLPPACGKVAYENANKMKNYDFKDPSKINCGTTDYPWLNINSTNKTRQAWVLCNDNYKLGCAQNEFSVNMTAEGENEAVTIKDKNGYNQICVIKKCMDYTNPTCTLNVTGTKSTHSGYYHGDKVTISFATKTDSISGIGSYDLTASSTASYNKNNSVPSSSITQGEKTYYGYVKDKATNTNSCNKKITVTFKHKITFNGNGGTPSFGSKDQYWKDPIGTLPTASRTGYKFDGWFTAASGGTKISTTTEMPSSDVTYYAHWTTKSIVVSFNCDGGTGGGSQTFTYGVAGQKFSTTCTKEGNHQTGWRHQNETTKKYNVDNGVSDDWINKYSPSVILDATWSAKSIDVKFDCDGGTGGGTETFIYGKSGQKFSKRCTKEGNHQTGWRFEDDKEKRYEIDNGVSSDWINKHLPSTTLYATYDKNICTIKYDPNGGKFNDNVNSVTQTFEYGKFVGDATNGMRNAKDGYYKATREDYYIDPSRAWISGDKIFNQNLRYNVLEFCPGLKTSSQTAVVHVNWGLIKKTKAFWWKYKNSDCNYNNGKHSKFSNVRGHPYRTYKFRNYRCWCKMDPQTGLYTGSLAEKGTDNKGYEFINDHRKYGKDLATVYYTNGRNGEAACRGSNTRNQKVYKVCHDSGFSYTDTDNNIGIENGVKYIKYHGYVFYEGNLTNPIYNKFGVNFKNNGKGIWLHQDGNLNEFGDFGAPNNENIIKGCNFACGFVGSGTTQKFDEKDDDYKPGMIDDDENNDNEDNE